MPQPATPLQPRHHHAVVAARKAREDRDLEATQGITVVDTNAPHGATQTSPAATTPAAVTPTSAAVTPVAAVTAVPNNIMLQSPVAPPQKSARELELEQQLLEERQKADQLSTQLITTQQTATVEQLAREEELATLRKFRNEIEINNLVALDGMEFETLDPAMAQEISQKVFKPLVGRLQKDYNERLNLTQAELRAEQQKRIEAETKMSEDQINKHRMSINDTIFKAHPDFEQVRNSPEFATYAGQPIRPGAALTLGSLMANEYHNGNADFVVQAVNDFKQSRPSLESIAGAPTTITATAPASESTEPQHTEADVAEWNRKRTKGEVTREEYGAFRQELNAQRAAAKASS